MKQIFSFKQLCSDKYYLCYSDRVDTTFKHILIFQGKRVFDNQKYGLVVNTEFREFLIREFYERDLFHFRSGLANYSLHGGIFELSEEEVMMHLVCGDI